MASTPNNVIIEDTKWMTSDMAKQADYGHLTWIDNPCVGYILFSSLFFSFVNYFTRWCLPKVVQEPPRSTNTRNPQEVKWKWRNILTSFIHSSITGMWAPLAFASQPSLGADMIHAYSTSAHALVSFSIGYFIYDFSDMALYHRKGSTYELLIHHGMVILCFGIAVSTRTYVAYAALSLVVEINSVFLHARQLLTIGGIPKSSWIYRTNAIMNVSTFVLFRILLLGWMTRWLTLNRDNVPLIFFSIGSLGLATIVGMNIVLFYKILVSDYFGTKEDDKQATHTAADAAPKECEQKEDYQVVAGNLAMQMKAAVHRRQPHQVNRIVRSLFDDEQEDPPVAVPKVVAN